jgi:cobalt-zinc-cadmium efflux system outer membrane protein
MTAENVRCARYRRRFAESFRLPLVVAVVAVLVVQAIEPSVAAAESVTVARAVAMALERNPDLLATRQQLKTAQGQVVKAHYLNQFNPQVQGGATQAQFGFAPGGSAAQPQGTVSLEVEVAGQRGRRIEAADQNLAEAKARVADAERLTIGQVKYTFYQALYLRERFALTERIADLNRRLRDAAVIRFHSGETSKLEADLAAIRYDQSRKVVLLARRDYENGVRALARTIGLPPDGTLGIDGALPVAPVNVDPPTAVRLAELRRPDLQARRYAMSRVDAQIALTRRLIVPNPTISGFFGESTDAPGQPIRVFGGSVGFSVPIFDRKQAELTALSGERLRASYERAAMQLTVEQEVRNAIAGYDAARETLALFESDLIGRVTDGFGLIETSYRAGKIGLLQLIVAENDLVTAQLSYLDSLWDYRAARVVLETAADAKLDEMVTKP